VSQSLSGSNWRWRDEVCNPGRIVIVDIDGVLSDAAGRQRFIDWGDWQGFFSAVSEDPVIVEMHRLLSLLTQEVRVVLVTGRPVRIMEETLAWLAKHDVRWDLLVMRDAEEISGVDNFKRHVLSALRDGGFSVELALDDDPKNHAMYVREGVACLYIHSGYYL
jgi:uncharacterized HAD superfamily protein